MENISTQGLLPNLIDDDFFLYSLATAAQHCSDNWQTESPCLSLRNTRHVPDQRDGFPCLNLSDLDILVTPSLIWAVVFRRVRSRVFSFENSLNPGMILSTSYRSSNHDGSALAASCGFFSRWDLPPWDTWVYLSDSYLLSFVPSEAMLLAQKGVESECMGIFTWVASLEEVRPMLFARAEVWRKC